MKLVKNVLLILIGLVIIGIGASTLRVAGLGVDPFTAMNIGLSSMFGMQLGIFQIIVNAFILFYVYLKNKKAIGLGTILNMLLVGILIQQISTWLQPYADSLGGSTIGKLLSLFVGVLIFTFGCALYMATDQGESPYDAIAPTICQQTLRFCSKSTRFVGPINWLYCWWSNWDWYNYLCIWCWPTY